MSRANQGAVKNRADSLGNPANRAVYLRDIAAILEGDPKYDAFGAVLATVLWGARDLGLKDGETLRLVLKGLEGFGVKVSLEAEVTE